MEAGQSCFQDDEAWDDILLKGTATIEEGRVGRTMVYVMDYA